MIAERATQCRTNNAICSVPCEARTDMRTLPPHSTAVKAMVLPPPRLRLRLRPLDAGFGGCAADGCGRLVRRGLPPI